MAKSLFKEEQKHSTPWVWMVIFPVISLYMYFMFDLRSDTNILEGDDLVGFVILFAVLFVMMIGLTVLFYKMKLTTLINNDGIHIHFSPFKKKDHFIAKSEIHSYEIIEYFRKSKLKGYSLKSKLKRTGKAYTISGKYGLVIYPTNGKKILIDTHYQERVRIAMNKLMN